MLEAWWPALLAVAVLLAFNLWRRLRRSSPEVVKEKLENGALVVDVRSPMEFQSGHFPGAINVPVEELMNKMDQLGAKDRSIVLYCASGARSGYAQSMLSRSGFTDVINAGGLFHIMAHARG
ncbi:MAG: rhodanese-like domain-containing protein [Leptospiraceae bacterium]|nr:rhodanese-like domain-containing protein [Leptospiraceae bacterium]